MCIFPVSPFCVWSSMGVAMLFPPIATHRQGLSLDLFFILMAHVKILTSFLAFVCVLLTNCIAYRKCIHNMQNAEISTNLLSCFWMHSKTWRQISALRNVKANFCIQKQRQISAIKNAKTNFCIQKQRQISAIKNVKANFYRDLP